MCLWKTGRSFWPGRAQNPPDLIILEVLPPMLDGFQLCRRLKAEAVTRAVPVLVYTVLAAEARAFYRPEVVEACLRLFSDKKFAFHREKEGAKCGS